MIEGLILFAELAAIALLLWTVQRRDTPGGRPPTSLFAYRDADQSPKSKGSQNLSRSERNA